MPVLYWVLACERFARLVREGMRVMSVSYERVMYEHGWCHISRVAKMVLGEGTSGK